MIEVEFVIIGSRQLSGILHLLPEDLTIDPNIKFY